ncbi:DUF1285 domain-containing protein [Novosphingobium resinovorum]|jgi:hypothetical protein|uniref:Proteophosphoglycan n=1 Tax=Novosphingobium resinovorum TaxID=158500 RepID=A0A1D8A1V8_9SPHN|nr:MULTISPECIES: DUF1285 domain-containing protein [Sphingomonadaceae]AOR76099.1 hypothetical protein BES08_04520 [Novosphingobium resinovorum]EJU13170.1 hypothetical protein LH128_09901 [Sphingomonas sp. LH128]MBF7011493.1 DUF1285 domain-containing protein [Novosphingobium sp. HR1a]WJM29467.1 DUF1285 domain-containing protein [Novosphingobium resinovorum]
MPYEPPPELAALSLDEVARLVAARKLPPVDQWSPAETGDSEMRIAADGRWFHQGGEIRRPAMVRAFASLLTCDADGQHWLVTPVQKLSIEVEDAAFIAIDVKREGGTLAFRLNTDDLVIAGPDHPITAEGDTETPALYVAVRHGTRARLNRSTYAQLAEIALESDDLSVTSNGARFALVPA